MCLACIISFRINVDSNDMLDSAERASFRHAIEMIPRAIQFPVGVEFDTVIIGMPRILDQVKTLSTGGNSSFELESFGAETELVRLET